MLTKWNVISFFLYKFIIPVAGTFIICFMAFQRIFILEICVAYGMVLLLSQSSTWITLHAMEKVGKNFLMFYFNMTAAKIGAFLFCLLLFMKFIPMNTLPFLLSLAVLLFFFLITDGFFICRHSINIAKT